ncbi:MAG: sulfite exporter TauE/SafE family protein [Paracoccaceae bacterium]
MAVDWIILTVASASYFIGGFAKGALGFGLPMVAIPMLTAFGSLPLALSIAVPPAFATNLWQFWTFRAHRDIPFLHGFLFTAILGLVAGTFLLKAVENAYLEIALGLSVLIFLFRPNPQHAEMKAQRKTILAPVFGGLAGIVHGAIGLSGLVAPAFFLAAGLTRPSFIFATSAMFIVMAVLHMPTLALAGLYEPSAFVIGLIVIVPAFAGVWIGSRLGDSLKASTFPILVKIMLTLAAILSIWGGLTVFLPGQAAV